MLAHQSYEYVNQLLGPDDTNTFTFVTLNKNYIYIKKVHYFCLLGFKRRGFYLLIILTLTFLKKNMSSIWNSLFFHCDVLDICLLRIPTRKAQDFFSTKKDLSFSTDIFCPLLVVNRCT